MRNWFITVLFVSSLMSCEKDISFDIENQPPKLVVDAQIEEGQPPIVLLTNTLNVFNSITPQLAAGSFVSNAKVTISNGTKTHQLKEFSIAIGGGFFLNYYSNNPANPSTAFVGDTNTRYNLRIETGGEVYTATTFLPKNRRTMDSLWWKKSPVEGDSNRVTLRGKFTDPIGLGDNIRYYTKINRSPFLTPRNSVFTDEVVDGRKFEFDIAVGKDRNAESENDPSKTIDFRRGDTITIKLCNIDKASYNFWNTLEFSYNSIGNPFSAPNKVLGNISNGALGVFCGYSVREKTIICK